MDLSERKDDTFQGTSSVIITNAANTTGTSTIHTPSLKPHSVRTDSTTIMSSAHGSTNERQRVNGEVALTPTHSSFTPHAMNPHNSMTAITPMASGSSQARNSVKLQ